MRVYEINFSLPSLWEDDEEVRRKKYNEIVNSFRKWTDVVLDNPLFELKEFDPTVSYFQPLKQLRSTVTDEEVTAIMEDEEVRRCVYGRVKLVHQQVEKQIEQVAEPRLASQEQAFNKKVEVHVPGNALAVYNKTQLCEDCCTEYLQDQLDLGWRIIAVCPQPDQRRPDYILGRYEP